MRQGPEADHIIFTRSEILFYVFFCVMLFSKGMGWYDGMPQYRICLLIGAACLMAKLLLSRYTLQQFCMAAVLGGLGLISYLLSGEKGMFVCMMVVIGMKDVPVRRAFLAGGLVWGGVFACRVLLFLTGIQRGVPLVHNKLGLGHIFRWSMGYPHPNVFHISYVILTAFLFYLIRWNQKKKLFAAVLAAFLGNCLIFLYSVSFTGFLLTGIYLAGVAYFELRPRFLKWEKRGILCVFPLCLIFSLAAPFLPQGRLFELLNKMMNTRLSLSRYFLFTYPVSLFGQRITVQNPDLTMDNSYVFALMTYGAVLFLLLMGIYFFLIRYMVREEKRKELAITLGFLIAGISEPFLFNTSFKNISLLFVGHYLYHQAGYLKTGLPAVQIGIWDWAKSTVRMPETAAAWLFRQKEREKQIRRRAAGHKALVAAFCLTAGLCGGLFYAEKTEAPRSYLVPVELCDFSQQKPFKLTQQERIREEEAGASIPVMVDDKTRLYRFDGNLILLERLRGTMGAVLLSGLCGLIPGVGVSLLPEKRK